MTHRQKQMMTREKETKNEKINRGESERKK